VSSHGIALFADSTGVRFGEACSIKWSDLDLKERIISLTGDRTKNKSGRTIPISDEVYRMLSKQFQRGEFVFSSMNFKRAWTAATKAAGCPDLLIHDLRRSAIRNYVRAGVSQHVVMAISGHKTTSVFARYNITSTDDIKDAMEKLQNKSNSNQTGVAAGS
jgi:integrase